MRPRIGISAYPKIYDTVLGPALLQTISAHYVESVRRAGGIPVVLPVVDPDDVRDLLGAVHGLVLSGGGDVDPVLYGQQPRPEVDRVDPGRDAFDLRLAREAVEGEVPMLAICRGLQVLNVALGGSLVQHVPAATGADHGRYDQWASPVHEVRVEAGTHLASVVGEGVLAVNSLHHQAVGEPAPGLRAVAWAEDGTVEAVEMPGHEGIGAVQWHPELLPDDDRQQALFRDLVARAAERAEAGAPL